MCTQVVLLLLPRRVKINTVKPNNDSSYSGGNYTIFYLQIILIQLIHCDLQLFVCARGVKDHM